MRLDVAVVGSERGFRALAGEWQTLFKGAVRATPFQSWPWLEAWWGAYGRPRVPRVVTVRREGQLVGALPLLLDRRWGRARLEFMGTGLSDHLDGLAEEGLEDEVAAAWVRGLRAIGGWTVADLQEVRPSAVVWGVFERWSPAVKVEQSVCLELPRLEWEEVLGAMSRNARKEMRRSLRAAERAGVVSRSVEGAELGAAVDALVAGHRAQWEAREERITGEHLEDRFQRFLRAAVVGMVEAGYAELVEFHEGDQLLARNLYLVGPEYVGDYLYHSDEETLNRFSVAAFSVRAGLDISASERDRKVNFLRGDEPWKRRWGPVEQINHRLLLGRWGPSWAAHAGYHLARSRSAAYLRSEDCPAWVNQAIERVRTTS